MMKTRGPKIKEDEDLLPIQRIIQDIKQMKCAPDFETMITTIDKLMDYLSNSDITTSYGNCNNGNYDDDNYEEKEMTPPEVYEQEFSAIVLLSFIKIAKNCQSNFPVIKKTLEDQWTSRDEYHKLNIFQSISTFTTTTEENECDPLDFISLKILRTKNGENHIGQIRKIYEEFSCIEKFIKLVSQFGREITIKMNLQEYLQSLSNPQDRIFTVQQESEVIYKKISRVHDLDLFQVTRSLMNLEQKNVTMEHILHLILITSQPKYENVCIAYNSLFLAFTHAFEAYQTYNYAPFWEAFLESLNYKTTRELFFKCHQSEQSTLHAKIRRMIKNYFNHVELLRRTEDGPVYGIPAVEKNRHIALLTTIDFHQVCKLAYLVSQIQFRWTESIADVINTIEDEEKRNFITTKIASFRQQPRRSR